MSKFLESVYVLVVKECLLDQSVRWFCVRIVVMLWFYVCNYLMMWRLVYDNGLIIVIMWVLVIIVNLRRRCFVLLTI